MKWRRRRRPGCLLFVLLGIMVLASLFVYLDRHIVPVMSAIARNKAEIWATQVMDQALLDTLDANLKYGSLIYTEKDREGRVTFMQPNLVAVNRIKLEALRDIQEQLGTFDDVRFGIPLGMVLGTRLFATRGPELPVGVIPTGVARVVVREEFEDAGINQTRHVLYLSAQAELQIVIPLSSETIEVANELPLVEAIIVGKIPQSYFDFRWGISQPGQ